jgi:hypothetical protein
VDGQADKTDLPRRVQDAERELRVLFERAGQWRSGGGAEPRCVERIEKKARGVGVVQGVDHVSFAARYSRRLSQYISPQRSTCIDRVREGVWNEARTYLVILIAFPRRFTPTNFVL